MYLYVLLPPMSRMSRNTNQRAPVMHRPHRGNTIAHETYLTWGVKTQRPGTACQTRKHGRRGAAVDSTVSFDTKKAKRPDPKWPMLNAPKTHLVAEGLARPLRGTAALVQVAAGVGPAGVGTAEAASAREVGWAGVGETPEGAASRSKRRISCSCKVLSKY
jgi:hypothetical protein